MEFLKRIGGYREDTENSEEGFTVAGMQMFGKGDSIIAQGCLPYFSDGRTGFILTVVGRQICSNSTRKF